MIEKKQGEKQIKRGEFIVLFFLIFLPFQYAMVGIIGVIQSEPWPALVLPAFKNVYSSDDDITLSQLQLYVQNENEDRRTQIDPNKVFNNIRSSQRLGFFETHFSDSVQVKNLSNDAKSWIEHRIKQAYPSLSYDVLWIEWVDKLFDQHSINGEQTHTKISKQFRLSLK